MTQEESIERKFEVMFKQHLTAKQLLPALTKIVDEYFQVDNQNKEIK